MMMGSDRVLGNQETGKLLRKQMSPVFLNADEPVPQGWAEAHGADGNLAQPATGT
jgi:hypothetical protein